VACSPSRSFRSLRGCFVRQSRDHVAGALAGAAHRLQPIERGNETAALAVGSSLCLRSVGQRRLDRGEGGWPNWDRDHRVKYGNGPGGRYLGQLHSYQRNQLPTTPDQKGNNQKDKEARGEQLATGMRGRRKVKTIIRLK
jgi:hypothetical protein